MSRMHYAGYIEVPDWDVSLRKGKHEGLISLETYETIQRRIKEGAKAPARKDISADFPLRGFVLCCDCNKPLTACWSTSKTGKKHPYYLCPTKGCPSYRKSIRRDELEGDFSAALRTLKPTKGLFNSAKGMFNAAWTQRTKQSDGLSRELKIKIKKLDKQIEGLLDRIVETSTPSVINAYETRLAKLERKKLVLAEKLQNSGKTSLGFDEMFELAIQFLANPCKLWDSGQLHLKRLVLRLVFSERISYCREGGLRTPKTSLPFKLLKDLSMGKGAMAADVVSGKPVSQFP